jgi:Ca-activated chloride channel family protein
VIELAYPWLLLLLPLPALLRPMLPTYRTPTAAIRVPWFDRLAGLSGQAPARGASVAAPNRLELVVMILLWALLVLALARPQWLEPPITRVLPTRDLLLLVDLSGSMETEDFTDTRGDTVDRLSAVKEVLDEFLQRREGDRVGLVVFGDAAFVQVPFTRDLEATRLLLAETAARMAGPRTAFGDAIGLGITLFERSPQRSKVMIALTDGNDTGSQVPPAAAARIAADRGIVIHVVGAGDPRATGGEALDEEALRSVASATGGRYYHGEDREQLAGIYAELDRLDSRELEVQGYRPRLELYHWPLGVFLVVAVLHHGLLGFARRGRARGTSQAESPERSHA